jgi:xanthine dehydrogenase YagR molybdenum-binding subunit
VTVAPSRVIGAPIDRIEGGEKVAGEARYAYEHEVEGAAYAAIVTSTVANGSIRAIDAAEALATRGVLAVLTHENAGPLEGEGELAILQSPRVAYRGQIVGAVIAETYEAARQAERLVRFE